MKSAFTLASLSALAGTVFLAACSSSTSDPQSGVPAPTAQTTPAATTKQPDAIIPATGSSLARGIDTWKVYDESDSSGVALRSVGVDAGGNQVAAIRIQKAGNVITITDLVDGGLAKVKTDGTVVQRTLANPTATAALLGGLHDDAQTYQKVRGNRAAFDCESLIALADAACALVYPSCVTPEPAEPLACASAVVACAAATDAANSCLNNCTGCQCPGATCPDGYSCTNGTCTQVCTLFGACGTDSCGDYHGCPAGQECVDSFSCCNSACPPNTCGYADDGCGGWLNCGPCPGGGGGCSNPGESCSADTDCCTGSCQDGTCNSTE